MKKTFLSQNFQFLAVKFSVYLNRRVFVMCSLYKWISGCTWESFHHFFFFFFFFFVGSKFLAIRVDLFQKRGNTFLVISLESVLKPLKGCDQTLRRRKWP